MEYRLATHLGSGEIVFSADERRLVVVHEKSGERRVIPYSSIKEINLRQDMPGAFTTVVSHTDGRAVSIPSRHFVGLGRFESRAAEYVPLVTELCRAAHAANSNVRFVVGSSMMFYAGVLVGVMALVLVGLFVVGGLMRGSMPPLRLLISVPVALVVAGGFLGQGRARPYDPERLPEAMLPRE